MIRIYKFNNNWKPHVRHHQFNRAFKNGMFGFSDARMKFAKVRFVKMSRVNPISFSAHNSKYDFGIGE